MRGETPLFVVFILQGLVSSLFAMNLFNGYFEESESRESREIDCDILTLEKVFQSIT